MFCKNCGKLLGSGDKFCPECGTRVTVEPQKPAPAPEPMFFVEKREEPIVEKKAKKVVHLDEFNWDLNGYPTENRKTEAVDFDWASVLEDKIRQASPKPAEEKPEPKKEKAEPLGEMPKTVEELLAALPDNVLEIVEEPEAEPAPEVVEEPAAETVVEAAPAEEAAVETKDQEIEVKSLEQIIEDFGEGPMDEPTRLIDKAQMKADSVESFYMFSKKQAEYQNLLDQEYDRIQSGLLEKDAEEEAPTPTVEEILAEEAPAEEPAVEEAPAEAADAEEETVETEVVVEEPVEEPVPEVKEPELVAVVWSMPPAGIIVEREPEEAEVPESIEEVAAESVAEEEPEQEPEEVPVEETVEETAEEPQAEEDAVPEEKPVKEQLTFADIFNDEEEEEEEVRKGGGCLKFIAVVLMLLVLAELGILGIQYFAKDSAAAKYINKTYGEIANMITGSETPAQEPAETPAEAPAETPAETPTGSSETEQLIAAQMEKNKTIHQVTANPELNFDTSQNYGYEELSSAYEFKNSPWYEKEDGTAVTYGEEIVGVLLQYYSALPGMINGVDEEVLEYVDLETPLYAELEQVIGDETRGYTISRLEIGEIKTGQKGFYVMVNVTSADQLQPGETQQKQIVYMETNPDENIIKIKETKNI